MRMVNDVTLVSLLLESVFGVVQPAARLCDLVPNHPLCK